MDNDKKSALRKTLLERRDAISHDMIEVCETQIRRNLRKIAAYRDADCIACYYSADSEVPTSKIILDAQSVGKRVCLPRAGDTDLEFAAIDGSESLVEGRFGILEPSPKCDVCTPDIVLVPTVGATRTCSRLGRGRGYYDRFLEKFDGVSIALAFSIQVVGSIPEDTWDQKVSYVLTENVTYRA